MKIPHLSFAPPALDRASLPDPGLHWQRHASRSRRLRRAGLGALALTAFAVVVLCFLRPAMVSALATQVRSLL